VSNELKCAEIWNQDWGFLAQGQGNIPSMIFSRQLSTDPDQGGTDKETRGRPGCSEGKAVLKNE